MYQFLSDRLGKKICTVITAALFIPSGAFPMGASKRINLNQLGFYPAAGKIAIAVGAISDTFYVYREDGSEKVFTGILGAAKTWSASNESARIADFTQFATPGSFVIRCAGCEDSYPFTIDDNVHLAVTKGAIKSFYLNRCSFELTEQFAGIYARKAGHPDTAVEIHKSAASATRPAGTKIASPGGWYDAGDYGKYIVNSGISTYTLFAAYEAFPAFFDTLKLSIPESSNSLPDLLDEALFNLRWMLTMQDPLDGGVYHKLTSANFCGMVMPDADKLKRYAVAKSTTATLDFAAVCAQASRLFRPFETTLPGFADTCLTAALGAWGWAQAHPAVAYKNSDMSSPTIATGEYGDFNPADELVWAATELYITTQQESYFTAAFPDGRLSGVNKLPSWPNVATLGLYSLLLSKKEFSKVTAEQINAAVKSLADSSLAVLNENPYHIAMKNGDFGWGSNSAAANRGMALVMGYLATQTESYRNAAIDQLDYLLGRNPVGISYITGFGDRSPMFIHHRPSAADEIAEPIPGFVAGGPNPGLQDTADCNYYTSNLPALAYLDSTCSYASNEIAINWNAPLVFLTGAVQALYGNKTGQRIVQQKSGKVKAAPYSKNQQGMLRIQSPFDGGSVMTVEDIRGRIMMKKTFTTAVALPVAWPLQVVVITIRPADAKSSAAPVSQMLLAGRR